MNLTTLAKFKYPSSLLREYDNWYLLLRDPQATFGSMIIINKDLKQRYSEIDIHSHMELFEVIEDIETKIYEFLNYDKINYLMLMMVDPEVHYHVIPRYKKEVIFNGNDFLDYGWPRPPILSHSNNPDLETIAILKDIMINILKK